MNPPRQPAPGHVLVVDDDPPTVRLIQFLLQDEGFDVLGASDAETALQEYRAQTPDLVLLNVVMPGVDGFELHNLLRTLGYGGPVMFVSARPDLPEMLLRSRIGAAGWLLKPLHPEELVVQVRRTLAGEADRRAG